MSSIFLFSLFIYFNSSYLPKNGARSDLALNRSFKEQSRFKWGVLCVFKSSLTRVMSILILKEFRPDSSLRIFQLIAPLNYKMHLNENNIVVGMITITFLLILNQ